MVPLSYIATALSTLPLTLAYYPTYNVTSTYAAAPTGTGSARKSIQTVAVGQNGLTFTPDTIFAKAGDEIVFQFFPKNHSVVQADFNDPCNPSDGAIFSGFVPTTSKPSDQSFTIKVPNEKPVWLYCAQNKPAPHCAAGMVAVINPPRSGPNTLDAFKQLAAKTNGSTVPAGGPSGGQISSHGSRTGNSTSFPSENGTSIPSGTGASFPSGTGASFPTASGASVPSGTGASLPSGTSLSSPPEFTGAASSLAVGGALGLMVMFAGLLL